VKAAGRKMSNSFWGQAWCDNLEQYSDYSNRLPRGRTYARNGSVVDLQIGGRKGDSHQIWIKCVSLLNLCRLSWPSPGTDGRLQP
jgi:hypothetical protein